MNEVNTDICLNDAFILLLVHDVTNDKNKVKNVKSEVTNFSSTNEFMNDTPD